MNDTVVAIADLLLAGWYLREIHESFPWIEDHWITEAFETLTSAESVAVLDDSLDDLQERIDALLLQLKSR